MKKTHRYALKFFHFFILTSFFAGCTNLSDAALVEPQNPPKTSTSVEKFTPHLETIITLDELVKNIEIFTAHNKYLLTDPITGNEIPVDQRIISGFQQSPPKQLEISNGQIVLWGWQEGQAEYQSIAIFDAKHGLRMTGVATAIPIIYSPRNNIAVASLKEYEGFLEDRSRYLPQPEVHLYAANQSDANVFYPLAARWLQAALMGFNTHCNDPAQVASCKVASEARMAIFLHTRECTLLTSTAPECRLTAPGNVPDFKVEVDAFKQ